MQHSETPIAIALLCLAAVTGYVDALAFMRAGGFFVAFASGNATRFAAGIGTGVGREAMIAGGLILSLMSGTILASVLARATGARARGAVMAAASMMLLAAAAIAWKVSGMSALLLLATAMGMVHLLFHREGAMPLTATMVRMAEDLAGALMGDPDRWGWARQLALVAVFAAGAVMGTSAEAMLGIHAFWFAGLAAATLALWFALLDRRATAKGSPVVRA